MLGGGVGEGLGHPREPRRAPGRRRQGQDEAGELVGVDDDQDLLDPAVGHGGEIDPKGSAPPSRRSRAAPLTSATSIPDPGCRPFSAIPTSSGRPCPRRRSAAARPWALPPAVADQDDVRSERRQQRRPGRRRRPRRRTARSPPAGPAGRRRTAAPGVTCSRARCAIWRTAASERSTPGDLGPTGRRPRGGRRPPAPAGTASRGPPAGARDTCSPSSAVLGLRGCGPRHRRRR